MWNSKDDDVFALSQLKIRALRKSDNTQARLQCITFQQHPESIYYDKHAHMVNGVFQVQDAIFDGVADIVLWVGSGGGHFLIGTALCKLLMLQQWRERRTDSQKRCVQSIRAFCFGTKRPYVLCRRLLTLIRIFLLSWLGEGRPSAAMSTALVSNMSPNTFLKWVAIFLCCTILQWSSMERMMG